MAAYCPVNKAHFLVGLRIRRRRSLVYPFYPTCVIEQAKHFVSYVIKYVHNFVFLLFV